MKKEGIGILIILGFLSMAIAALVIPSEIGYNSVDVNITQENNFSHLNVSDSNLVFYMPFDNNFTEANRSYDYTNNSNDGELRGNVSWGDSGWVGGAGVFNGFDSGIVFSDFNKDNYTISAWINPNNFFQVQTVVGWYKMQVLTTGRLRTYLGPGNDYFSNSTATVDLNEWNHVALTLDGGNLTFYKNAIETGRHVSTLNSYSFNSIGRRNAGSTSDMFNGSIDEVMIFDRALSSSEIAEIYSNQSERFFPTGTMLFQNNDLGENRTVNVSINDCGIGLGSRLRAKINSGDWANFSDCELTNYVVSGNLTNANLTIGFISGNESSGANFYSPLVSGDITLEGFNDTLAPRVEIVSPSGTYASGSIIFNLSVVEGNTVDSCWYSLDSGVSNQTLTQDGATNYYSYKQSSMLNGNYISLFWCNDSDGNLNNAENISFSIAISEADSSSSSSGGSSYLNAVVPDYYLERGYEAFIPKNYDVKFKIGEETHSVRIDNIVEDVVTVTVSSVPKTFDLSLNESRKVDLEDDGVYDVEVYLKLVRGNYANVVITKIDEAYSEDVLGEEVVEEVEGEVVGEEVEKVGFFKKIWNWIRGLFGF